jgi:hypothetical protein
MGQSLYGNKFYRGTKFLQTTYSIYSTSIYGTSYTKVNVEKFNILRHVTLLLLMILSLYRKGTNAPDRVMCFKTNY